MSSSYFPHLFSPITVHGKTFKNRICCAPVGIFEEPPYGEMSQKGIDYYTMIASGGTARVVTGENDVLYGSAVSNHYWFFLPEMPERVKISIEKYVAGCHRYGALAFVEFGFLGVYGRRWETMREGLIEYYNGRAPLQADGKPYDLCKPFGPSDMVIHQPWDGVTSGRLNLDNPEGNVITEATIEEMNEVADAFATCLRNAKACGIDGVVLHSGHGFIFAQWLSRRFNKRTDEFGGSMENRARFPLMCLQRMRDAVGDDFVIEMRFSPEENISPITDKEYVKDTVTLEESIAFFKEIDKHPGLLDILHVSGGLHFEPIYNTRVTASSLFPMGVNVPAAAAMKKELKNIKIGVVGSLSDPELCEQIIAEGKADFVNMARQLMITDYEFPNKAMNGQLDDINNCLRCTICRKTDVCAIAPYDLLNNPSAKEMVPTKNPKKIVVIGGGIAGMKAAEYAAKAGHRVVLFEKSNRLSGILNYTDHDKFKQDIFRYKTSMERRIKKLPIDIRLSVKATPELVKQETPDVVVVAVGAKSIPAGFPVEEGVNLIDAVTAYTEPEKVVGKIAIIGGGLTGCDAVIHFAEQGREVTLISRSKELMRKMAVRGAADGGPDTHLIWFDVLKPEILKGYACKKITKEGVWVSGDDGDRLIKADTIINASGMAADTEEAAKFEGTAPVVKSIGDCVKAGLISDAVLAAYQTIREIG